MKPEKEKLRVVVASGADKAFEYIANLLPCQRIYACRARKKCRRGKTFAFRTAVRIFSLSTHRYPTISA
ncbi:MAG: hypothetical protein L6V93_22355 [Clostridiales bacterium]|nr:MAG: hypothetical protein L6V93_22355 [Clostridiales bacterium]